MWSHAVYNLRVKSKHFWRLTPRQYDLLDQRHRDALVHREMCHAFTTAAVVNYSFSPPEKPTAPMEWMPHFEHQKTRQPQALLVEKAAKDEWDGKVTQLSAELKAHAETGAIGPAMKALGYGTERLDGASSQS